MRPLRYLPIVISIMCAISVAQMARHDLRYLVPAIAIAAMVILPPILTRRRRRALLLSGDVKRVLGTWQAVIDRVMFPETMAPLMAATAYVSYGWIDAARFALDHAARGPAWDAAVEQRLFIEALLDTFQGDRASGLQKAEALLAMPLPRAGPFARQRVARLRRGVAALARVFSHRSDATDGPALRSAAASTPLVFWAMRYGSAVLAIDQGELRVARDLLVHAPSWPRESAFRVFDEELRGLVAG